MIFDVVLCDRYTTDHIILRDLIHNIQHEILDDRTQRSCTCLFLGCLHGNCLNGIRIKLQIDLIEQQKLLILL